MIFRILPGLSFPQIVIVLVAFAVAIVIAISFHEWAHAFAAYRAGDHTAKQAGRLTLNPLKHLEPLGLICFVFVGIGWAKPVPVNPFNYRSFKKGNFWVSISGVLTNLLIAFVFSFGLFMVSGPFEAAPDNLWWFGLYQVFSLCMLLNVSLAVFNMLPIPPLDGYNLLMSFTKPNNGFMLAMRNYARVVLIIVVLFGGVVLFTVRDYIQDAMLGFWGLFL